MICGVDEAGRGPVFGPLVIAGVMFKDESVLRGFGIRDSKQLTAKKRASLCKIILQKTENSHVISISAEDIDLLRKTMTLNEIEVNAFRQVVEKLHPDVCYVDSADVNDTRFGRNIGSQLSYTSKIISKHKADELFPVVSAASIVAKVTRDQEIIKIADMLTKKLPLPFGSGYPADPLTKRFLEEWVTRFGKLPPHVRKSWKTAENILQKKSNKRLDEF